MRHSFNTSRLMMLTAIGGCLEFFDFTIFALFSTYISQAFFPFENHVTALINTFAVFAVGYFARPLGGVWISHFGDRFGRKTSLVFSIHLMAISTLFIAILPDFSMLGLMAPVALIFLRLLQGVALGGEMPGIITYLTEHLEAQQAMKAIGITLGMITLGNVLASGMGFLLSAYFSSHVMALWGWRIPFFMGALLGFVGWGIRKRTHETDIFIALENEKALHQIPCVPLIQYHWRAILLGMGLTAATTATVFLFLYLPVLLHNLLQQTIQKAYLFSTISFIFLGFMTIFFGCFAKKETVSTFMRIGLCFIFMLSLMATLAHWNTANAWGYFCVLLAIFAAMVNACYSFFVSQLFPAAVRYSGVACAYNLGMALFGALTPFLFLHIFQEWNFANAPFGFLMIASGISYFCFQMIHK